MTHTNGPVGALPDSTHLRDTLHRAFVQTGETLTACTGLVWRVEPHVNTCDYTTYAPGGHLVLVLTLEGWTARAQFVHGYQQAAGTNLLDALTKVRTACSGYNKHHPWSAYGPWLDQVIAKLESVIQVTP